MNLKKENIAALQIPDDLKADLLSLFDTIETKESELDKLREKVPTDSQKVVEGVDYDKYLAATEELKTLKEQLAAKLGKEGGQEGGSILTVFSSFFGE